VEGVDRKPPDGVRPDVVLQPRWPPRLGYSLAVVVMTTFAVWSAATDESAPLVVWSGLAVALVLFVKAWVDRVVIIGPVLYHQALFRWSSPLRASDLEKVTLYYEPGRIDWFQRELTLFTQDGRSRRFSVRWWDWAELIAWLTRCCTRTEDDQIVWAVRTDEKTRSRLEPYAERHLPGPPPA
jgi:hypothetical protein